MLVFASELVIPAIFHADLIRLKRASTFVTWVVAGTSCLLFCRGCDVIPLLCTVFVSSLIRRLLLSRTIV